MPSWTFRSGLRYDHAVSPAFIGRAAAFPWSTPVRRPIRPEVEDRHRRRFERLVGVAMRHLPRNFARYLDNVALLVVDEPSPAQRAAQGLGPDETLLGLYEGIPQTQRTSSYGMVLPDRITLFRKPIEAACATEADLIDEIRRTVIHEVAHHCGYEEEQLHE